MFERFTPNTRQVLAFAQEEARFFGQSSCRSEHLLLGLLRDDGPSAEALGRQGVTLDGARRAVAAATGRGEVNRAGAGDGSLSFSDNAKAAIGHSASEADAAGSAQIDSIHLLFALLRNQGPTVQHVLANMRSERAGLASPGSSPAEPQERGQAAATATTGLAPIQPGSSAPQPGRQRSLMSDAVADAGHVAADPLEARVDALARRVDQLASLVAKLEGR